MSYLSQLAARTLNQLPSMQPRLPARFESARREVQPEATAPLEYATFTSSAPAIPRAVAASTPKLIAREMPPSPAADAPSPAAAPPPHPWLDAAPTHTTLVIQPEPRAEAKSELTAPAAPIERNTVTHMIERDGPTASTNTTIEQHTLIERDGPTASTNTTIEQHTLIEQRTLIEHEGILAPMPNTTPEARMRAPRVAPQVMPYVPPAPAYSMPPQPAPVIKVSIGRIEVRAVHTPTASAPPAPAAKPSLSLDDYLRGGRS
jgi:hypothetical protein